MARVRKKNKFGWGSIVSNAVKTVGAGIADPEYGLLDTGAVKDQKDLIESVGTQDHTNMTATDILNDTDYLNAANTDKDALAGGTLGQGIWGVIKNAGKDALQTGNGWAALASAVVGAGRLVGTRIQAKKGAAKLNEELEKAKRQAAIQRSNAFNDVSYKEGLSSLLNSAAYGGKLNMNNTMDNFSNGVNYFANGGTHEENPREGIPIGIDPQGVPNLVEEGEVIFNNYVYSNRLHPSFAERKMLQKATGLTKSQIKGKSYADIANILNRESKERPNDPLSRVTNRKLLEKLAESQERLKQAQQEAYLSKMVDMMSPQEKAQMVKAAKAQQELEAQQMAEYQQQLAQQQQVQQQAEQQAQQQQMQQYQQQQQDMEQQLQQQQQPQQPQYALGGNLHKYAGGGNLGAWMGVAQNIFNLADSAIMGDSKSQVSGNFGSRKQRGQGTDMPNFQMVQNFKSKKSGLSIPQTSTTQASTPAPSSPATTPIQSTPTTKQNPTIQAQTQFPVAANYGAFGGNLFRNGSVVSTWESPVDSKGFQIFEKGADILGNVVDIAAGSAGGVSGGLGNMMGGSGGSGLQGLIGGAGGSGGGIGNMLGGLFGKAYGGPINKFDGTTQDTQQVQTVNPKDHTWNPYSSIEDWGDFEGWDKTKNDYTEDWKNYVNGLGREDIYNILRQKNGDMQKLIEANPWVAELKSSDELTDNDVKKAKDLMLDKKFSDMHKRAALHKQYININQGGSEARGYIRGENNEYTPIPDFDPNTFDDDGYVLTPGATPDPDREGYTIYTYYYDPISEPAPVINEDPPVEENPETPQVPYTPEKFPTWMRYAPAWGAHNMLINEQANPTNFADEIRDIPLRTATPERVYSYVRPHYADVNLETTKNDAIRAMQIDQIQRSSMTPTQKANAIMALQYNTAASNYENRLKAAKYNAEQDQLAANFNRQTDQFNAQAANQFDLFNTQSLNRGNLQKGLHAAEMAQSEYENSKDRQDAYASTFYQSLGDIGKENWQMNQWNSSPANRGYIMGQDGTISYATPQTLTEDEQTFISGVKDNSIVDRLYKGKIKDESTLPQYTDNVLNTLIMNNTISPKQARDIQKQRNKYIRRKEREERKSAKK